MKLYTVKEVSEMLKFKEGTIRNMISDKKIKTIQITGTKAVRVTQEEVDRLVKGE